MADTSVVITTYNQPNDLKEIMPIWKSHGVEIIVSSDGSEDQESERQLVESYGGKYVWRADDGFRQSEANQAGLDLATKPFVFFCDAEARPSDNLIADYEREWMPGYMLLGPRQFLENGEWIQDFRDWTKFSETNPWYICGCNMFCDTEALREVGGWCKEYVGYGMLDYDVGFRWIHSGRRYMFMPECVISFNIPRTHPKVPDNVANLFNERIRLLGSR
jgi:GT2 family glycosyltransferase